MKTPLIDSSYHFDDSNIKKVDIFICALGYESRSVFLAKKFEEKIVNGFAIGFTHNRELNYDENRKYFEKQRFVLEEVVDTDFDNLLKSILDKYIKPESKIVIDISSFNRYRIAAIISYFNDHKIENIEVIFIYNIAEFSKPKLNLSKSDNDITPNTYVDPIHPSFAGWSIGTSLPNIAIVGLGYEEDRAIGALEYLQISNAILFQPKSPIEEYFPEVKNANKILYEFIDENDLKSYNIQDPFSLYRLLEYLVSKSRFSYSITLLPFGPKIFTLICLLVCLIYKDLSVWRVSKGHRLKAHERKPSKYSVGIKVIFRKNESFMKQIYEDVERGMY